MMRKIELSLSVAAATISMAMFAECSPLEPLSQVKGQALVKDAFRNVPFWTGAWGNDVSSLFPFQWSVPGKGIFTYFSAAEHKYHDGRAWELDEIGSGSLRYCKHDWSPSVDVWFTPEQLFEVEYSKNRRILCYHNERMRGSDVETAGVGFVEEFIWYELNVSTNGCPCKTLLKGWPEALFADEAFKSICNVVPLDFRGADAEVVHEKDEIRKRLDECAVSQSGWNMDVARKSLIVAKHRRYALENHSEGPVTAVYIVACDVNHDKICDAYVTSDLEAVGNGRYKWSLYIGSETGFSRQTESVKFSIIGSEDLYCEADVVAARVDFLRVDRIMMPPYVMVLARLDGHPESWSYMHHENPVRDFRRRDGFAKADYYSCLANGKSGVSSIRDLFLSYYTIVRAERLPCETINCRLQK